VRVDETTNEPGAGDAIDVDALAGHPGTGLIPLSRRLFCRGRRVRGWGEARSQRREQPVHGFSTARTEVVDCGDLVEAALEPLHVEVRPTARLVARLVTRKPLLELPRFVRDD